MKKTFFVMTCLLVFAINALAVELDFTRIDTMVRSMPRARSANEVAAFLNANASGEWEKTRGAYVWITENIAYDADAFLKGTRSVTDAEGVFRARKTVCSGYSALFADILRKTGLSVAILDGYAKGYGYRQNTRFGSSNHAWNTVKINNRWYLFDSTWGAGSVDGTRFVKRYTDFWFATPPEIFLYHHLPKDTRLTFTGSPISLAEYERRPFVDIDVLEALSHLGFSQQSIQKGIASGGLPKSFVYPGYRIRVLDAPVTGNLKIGRSYTVQLETADVPNMNMLSGGKWIPFEKKGSLFQATFTADSEEIKVMGQLAFKGQESHWPLLVYRGIR